MLMALWCIAFALVNVFFEATDHFAGGPAAKYAAGISVMNWLVVGIKLLGAAVALLSVANIPKLQLPALMTVLLWETTQCSPSVLGSITQALGMITGLTGTADQIDLAGVGYVFMFLMATMALVSWPSLTHDVTAHGEGTSSLGWSVHLCYLV